MLIMMLPIILNVSINALMVGGCLPPSLASSCEIKSLGVILDCTLSWKPQINQVAKRVNCALFGLRLIKPCTTQVLRIRLV